MKHQKQKRGFWRTCRVYFRRFRITLWLLVILLLGTVIYLNQVGLPTFLKQPLLDKLRARGIDLQFSRLRLRWEQGVVADNVRFGRADDLLSPQLHLRELKLSLDKKALRRFKLQLDGVSLRQGRLVLPVAETNGPPRQLAVEDIQTELHFLPGDRWALDSFTAGFAGAHLRLSGIVSNASTVRNWKLFSGKPAPPGALQSRLRALADTLATIHFSESPELRLDLRGDARDLQSFKAHLAIRAIDAETPWGTVRHGFFSTRVWPASSNELSRAEIDLEAQAAETRWGTSTNLHLLLDFIAAQQQTNLIRGALTFSAGMLHTDWGEATNTLFTAHWLHALTNPIPISGEGHLECAQAKTTLAGGASAATLRLAGRLLESNLSARKDPSWGWWTNLEPYALEWDACLTELDSPKLLARTVAGGGTWRAPQLLVTNLQAELYDAKLAAGIQLDVDRRFLSARLDSDADPHSIEPLLTEGARRWLSDYTWNQAPELSAEAALVLPAWTNRHPDWRAEVQPTLRLAGQFNIRQGGTYRDIPVSSAQSHFIYSNMTWRLPDLAVTRPEGRLEAVHQANDRTKEFYWKINSSMDVRVLRPLLRTNQQRDLDLLGFTQPPFLKGEIWGRFHDGEQTGFRGEVRLTNVTVRGESLTSFQSTLQYTNRFLLLTNAEGWRGTQCLRAARLGIDFQAEKIYLADGFSTAEPQVVARAIGPKVGNALEPYQFLSPPTVHVHGIIPIHNEADADLTFDVDGGRFHWSRFNLKRLSGQLHWKGERLSLENVRADCYGGTGTGSASFHFRPERGTEYQFNLSATNARLELLMADVSSHTNNLEGALSGSLIVNQANSEDWRSWQGGGNATLGDGLIWEIPIFGIFSPVLNSIAPGLGSSRASDAAGSFVITNGVIRSNDLEIRSPAMRLRYRGTVDLQGQVNARVEAELLRDVWFLGPLVSTVFWPVTKVFEYKVSGSLAQPKTDQVYFIGKMILLPFHPFRTLKDLLPEDTGPARTNAPPNPKP